MDKEYLTADEASFYWHIIWPEAPSLDNVLDYAVRRDDMTKTIAQSLGISSHLFLKEGASSP